MSGSRRWPALLAATALLVLSACTGAGATGAPAPEAGEVVVFAAASLSDAFEQVAAEVEAEHPDLDVVVNVAGSQRLAAQILSGAPADVFAAADEVQMARIVEAGLVSGTPTVFASNRLALAVEPGNPRGVRDLADLSRPDLTVVLADPAVPAGRYAAAALDDAGVAVAPASFENDVRAVLSKVALGEADAGLVYRSDIVAADGDVEEVALGAAAPRAAYPVAILADAPNPDGAAAVVAALTSSRGRRALAAAGFGLP